MALECGQRHKRLPAFCVVAVIFFLVNGLAFHRHWDKGERLGWRGKLEGRNDSVGHATSQALYIPKIKFGLVLSFRELYHGLFWHSLA